ncbi:MAG: KH domain-containing protein [Actinobacteria bacterium]|nr:KH domain-containing protein [Actinomycetota bacterium]
MTDAPADELDDDVVDDDRGNRASPIDTGDDEDDAANRIPGATATQVLDYLVKALVDDPDAVEIEVDDDRRGLRLQVRVGPGDMGRVIGRRGRLANAVRTVVRAAAVDDRIAVDVDFVD